LSSQPSQGIKVGFKCLNLLYRAIGTLSFDNPLLAVTKHNVENRFCHYPCLSAAFPDISTTLYSVNSLQKWMAIDAGLSEDANRMRRNWQAQGAIVVGVTNAKRFCATRDLVDLLLR
jgi:hypothetical protein